MTGGKISLRDQMVPNNTPKIHRLIQKYGSPLFIVYSEKIKSNLEQFKAEFSAKYPKVTVAYSYKVNYLPEVLKIIHHSGAWAEVASGFEYEIARRLDVPGNSIVYNGPFKTDQELERAIGENAIVNADHLDEIRHLEAIASKLGREIDIGIRLNMEVGIDQLPDRFGFNIESGEALETVKRCKKNGLLNIKGLHVHLTSYIIEKESEDNIPARGIRLIWPKGEGAYKKAAEKIVLFAKEITQEFGIKVDYLDMGGGFPAVEGITSYVDAIVGPVLNAIKDDKLPDLILEPGRAVVANAVDLCTTVAAVKLLSGGQRAVVVDSGINVLPTSFWKYQDIELLSEREGGEEETIVYGPLCLQTDIISKTMLPQLKPGDVLMVKNVGAYNIPQSSTFIYPLPPVALIENDSVRLIRRKQKVEEIF